MSKPDDNATIGRESLALSFPSRVSRLSREECDILHDHGLHGGGFLLLHLLREARESDEDGHGIFGARLICMSFPRHTLPR